MTYNLNGIRAAIRKGLIDWISATDPDILCFQEVKASEEVVYKAFMHNLGYHIYWHAADKKGYSGVALFSKTEPKNVSMQTQSALDDQEGRLLIANYADFTLINVYIPSGTSGEIRQAYKMQWLDHFYRYTQELIEKEPKLVVGGDLNICHKPIDIHNPVSNKRSSGFLPEEREWLSKYLDIGFIDSFRYFNQEPHHYTWWSNRLNARDRNLGWRLDYYLISNTLEGNLKRSEILKEARHSDHCPVMIELDCIL